MALPSSGQIKFSELRDNYFSSGSVSLSDYYKNGGIVEAGQQGVNIGIPISGVLSLSDFYDGVGLHILNNPNIYTISSSESDNFGWSAAIDGNYAIVGAPYETETYTGRGVVYIFNVTTGQLIHSIDNPNPDNAGQFDSFGTTVAISGNYAIVGAQNEDDAFSYSGKAYIFNVTTGALVHTLDNPNAYGTSYGDSFGYSVAISGNYAIVGAYLEDREDGRSQSGKAYIFNVTTGALVHTLDNPNAYSTATNDWFGYSVGISGNYAIVGAYLEDEAGGDDSGKVYVYNVTTGALVHTLDNPNAYGSVVFDHFGRYIAISGNYAIIGADGEDDAGGGGSGKAYIFNVTTGTLIYTLDNPNAYGTSASDDFGSSVAISGNYAIVGAPFEDYFSGNSAGKVYVYKTESGNWSDTALIKTLDTPNPYSTAVGDLFGYSVSISNGIAIFASPYDDDANQLDTGRAYIFNLANL